MRGAGVTHWFGLAAPGAEDDSMLMGLAELIAAISDGLSMPAGLSPEGFELSRPLVALEFLLHNSMGQLLALAADRAEKAKAQTRGSLQSCEAVWESCRPSRGASPLRRASGRQKQVAERQPHRRLGQRPCSNQ
jgi:hypothetical protein